VCVQLALLSPPPNPSPHPQPLSPLLSLSLSLAPLLMSSHLSSLPFPFRCVKWCKSCFLIFWVFVKSSKSERKPQVWRRPAQLAVMSLMSDSLLFSPWWCLSFFSSPPFQTPPFKSPRCYGHCCHWIFCALCIKFCLNKWPCRCIESVHFIGLNLYTFLSSSFFIWFSVELIHAILLSYVLYPLFSISVCLNFNFTA
jgi:hypothetical protein